MCCSVSDSLGQKTDSGFELTQHLKPVLFKSVHILSDILCVHWTSGHHVPLICYKLVPYSLALTLAGKSLLTVSIILCTSFIFTLFHSTLNVTCNNPHWLNDWTHLNDRITLRMLQSHTSINQSKFISKALYNDHLQWKSHTLRCQICKSSKCNTNQSVKVKLDYL